MSHMALVSGTNRWEPYARVMVPCTRQAATIKSKLQIILGSWTLPEIPFRTTTAYKIKPDIVQVLLEIRDLV